jgi:hypothetical protein
MNPLSPPSSIRIRDLSRLMKQVLVGEKIMTATHSVYWLQDNRGCVAVEPLTFSRFRFRIRIMTEYSPYSQRYVGAKKTILTLNNKSLEDTLIDLKTTYLAEMII